MQMCPFVTRFMMSPSIAIARIVLEKSKKISAKDPIKIVLSVVA